MEKQAVNLGRQILYACRLQLPTQVQSPEQDVEPILGASGLAGQIKKQTGIGLEGMLRRPVCRAYLPPLM